MKLLFLPFLGIATLVGCNTQSNNCTISGTTDLQDGEMVYISCQINNDSTFVDSAAVANGQFSFDFPVDYPRMAYVSHGKIKYLDKTVRPFMTDKGQINIELTGEDYSSAPVSGSVSTAQMDSLTTANAGYNSQLEEMRGQYPLVKDDPEKLAEFEATYTGIRDKIQENKVNFLKSHKDSYYSPVLMRVMIANLPLEEVKSIYESWTPDVKAADDYTESYITRMEAIAPGADAPAITGKDQNEQDVALVDLKGKVVLVDFWATWCGPCRASLPHIKDLFEKYNGKGLEVLAVSLDREKEPWVTYIAESGMGMEKYHNIYDEGGANADVYAIQYIPSKFLIDADGKMIGRFDNEDELDSKLKEIFGE